MRLILLLALGAGVNLAWGAEVPPALSMGGQLFDGDGTPITAAGVDFKVEIFDAAGQCVLYVETHANQNLRQSQGRFNLTVGAGSAATNNVSGTTQLDASVFANPGVVNVANCASSTVALSAGDARKIRLSYDFGGGSIAMTPDVSLVSAAYALIADTVQGKGAADFIQVSSNGSSALTQANAQYAFSTTNWPSLKALLDGTSEQYVPLNGDGNALAARVLAQGGTPAFPGFAFQNTLSFNAGNGMGMFFAAQDELGFSTTSTERLRISSAGNVGIGTTAPTTALQVAGVITPSADNTYALGSSGLRFTDIYAVNATVQTSDARQKKDVAATDLGLDFVTKLRPVSFKWKTGADVERHYGLIAQETKKILDATEEGGDRSGIVTHDAPTDRYGIRYGELIAPLIRAVQELYASLNGIDERVRLLETENARLKQDAAEKTKRLDDLERHLEKIERRLASPTVD